MGYKEKERVQVKLEFLRMLSRLELAPAKTALIYVFFETYLQLNGQEEFMMQEEIAKLPADEAEKVFRLPNSYYEKGIKHGIEQGIEQLISRMLKNGLTVEDIARFTNISAKKIEEISKHSY